LTTVGAIRQLAAEEARRGYPVRIRGGVTLNNPYMSLMFVQDASGGIYLSPEKLPWPERAGFSQGMRVQIEGRTSFGRFSPTVRGKEDAAVVVKVLGRAPLPEPLQPSIVQLADPRYQNQWIEISGVVRQVTSGSLFEGAVESVAVTVVSPAGRVTAAAFRDPPTKNLPTELVGATVCVRGVFTAILNNNDQFLGMWLATAAPDDFHVVGPSPGEAFALPVRPIASLMRFDVLHAVSERVRIQGTVTQVQLDTVSAKLPEAPAGPRQLLDLARSLLRHSRAEARRSIMDLRASLLEGGDLASALEEVAARARDGQPVAVEAVVEGRPRRLPGKIETNLLRIAQEALANALKHGKPSRVTLWLSFAEQGVELRVEDDGAGFDVEQAMALSAGHFGLLGMRERAEGIHAGFKIRSAAGKGTTVKVAADDNPPERNPQ
jgi:hypothetical protein